MNARDALGRLRRLRVPAVTTADAAAIWVVSTTAASHTLHRLAAARLLTSVRRGLWALSDRPDALVLAEHVTAPYPSYVSLQTALYRRGMITQIPSMIYVASLARRGRIETSIGTYSVHHIRPELFGGFEHDPVSGMKLAIAEKALFDFLYLSPTRGRLFAALPEIELPRGFRRNVVRGWVKRIPSHRTRTIVEQALSEVLAHHL